MDKKNIGFLLLITLGVSAILGVYFLSPILKTNKQINTSDAKEIKQTIRVGVDNWVGYYILDSKEMKKMMRLDGYVIECVDDNSNLDARMKKLKNGDLNFAVATIDSYLINGFRHDFPGTIIAVIDQSKGGDKIVARKDKITNLEDLKKKDFKIAFTPSSPSEYLLKCVGTHFDVPKLKNKKGEWRVETDGSSAALNKILSGAVDVAVLWEPDATKALENPNIIEILGTENVDKLIVDILLVNRDFSAKFPKVVTAFLKNYFTSLKFYRDNPAILRKELSSITKIKDNQIESMLKGVEWKNLNENANNWFGINFPGQQSNQEIVDAIESTIGILLDNSDFIKNPLPENDPYRIINSQFIEELFLNAFLGNDLNESRIIANSLDKKFDFLDAGKWHSLREVGALKIRPITFQSGSCNLDLSGKEEIDKIAENLKHYPNFRIVIKGHTSLSGNIEENKILSRQRAEAVARYFMTVYNMDSNRINVIGSGAEEPLPRIPGEPDRAYNYRLPRVEIFLVTEVY